MSNETTGTENQETENNFDPITSQEALDKIVSKRVMRERDKYKNFDKYKEKASLYDKAEEAKKSEIEKLTTRAERAERELETFKQERQVAQWKSDVSKETGVDATLLRGSTLEDIQEHANSIAEAYKPTSGVVVEGEGRHTTVSEGSGDWLRDALSNNK